MATRKYINWTVNFQAAADVLILTGLVADLVYLNSNSGFIGIEKDISSVHSMSLLSGILQSQAPAKQDATTAIQTLCLRLTTSSLVEDRRAAILSLRSFAREYKETVASGGLRGLIQTLAKDYEDVDTAKVVLETLLLLFAKDETNVSEPELL